MARTKKQIVTAAITFSFALGIGTAMQYGEALASRWGADAPVGGPGRMLDTDMMAIPVVANMTVPVSLPSQGPLNQHDGLTATPAAFEDITVPEMVAPSADDPAFMPPAAMAPAPTQEIPAAPQLPDIADAAPSEPICETTMTATPADFAMVTLDIMNNCRPFETLSVHHQGMMFHVIADQTGHVTVDVPALRQEAFFIAAYDDGEGAVAMTGVPNLALYDRAVLQWQGEEGVQLHALEFGATYGAPGHVWAEAPTDGMVTGGFLTSLGNPAAREPLMAEVYTFPTGIADRDGAVSLSVEAEITARNCGRDISAQSLQILSGDDVQALDLTMTMPGCDAVGEFLVLKNMFEDLTIAAK